MQALSDDTFERIAALMHERIGVAFAASRKPLISSRLAPRMQRIGVAGFEDYLSLITSGRGADEFQVAVDLLTTHETYFFREPAHYALIEEELGRARAQQLAVWSAASSFGDEAYSVAMLLADLQSQGRIGRDWSVLGTDISDHALRVALEAVYPQDRLRLVTPARLKRYCLRGSGESAGLVQIGPGLRERVSFGQLNLCAPIEPLGPFDIVLLRNVLIYFDAATKRSVIDRVLDRLKPGGLLFIGTAEGRPAAGCALQMLAPGAFRKPA